MGSENAKIVARKVSENIRKGKRVMLGKIIKETGYAESTSESPTLITKTKSYRKEIKPFIDRLIAHRDKIQEAMDTKDLTKEQYRVLSEAMAKANHDIQLLGGKPTENVNLYDWGNYKDNNIYSENLDKGIARKPEEMESDSSS